MNINHKQRFIKITLSLLFMCTGIGLLAYSLSNNIDFYVTPTEIKNNNHPPFKKIRVGGIVVPNSVIKNQESLTVTFKITDTVNAIDVFYTGILPDLFKENKGIVSIGKINEEGVLIASQILAKHDENYQSPEVNYSLEKAGQ